MSQQAVNMVKEEAWKTYRNLRRTELIGKDLCMMSPGVVRDLMDDDDDQKNINAYLSTF